MTRINRIVTSQVEGRTLSDQYADNSMSYDENGKIYYYGENKMGPLVGPGVVYGSNADSGDGYGLDTLKLIPHAPDGFPQDDRYIVIDPTSPNHIHIRAGGTQDASNAELILGAEQNHVRVSDLDDSVNILASNVNINSMTAPSALNINTYVGAVINSARTSAYTPEDRVVATLGDVANVFPSPVAWTPLLSAIGFAQTSNPATGEYMKYGRMVVANLNVPFSNVANFGTGQYSINLPFPVAKHTDVFGGTLHDTDTNSFYTIKGHANAGESTMTLWYLSIVTKDAEFDSNSPFMLDTTDLFHMNFIYETTV